MEVQLHPNFTQTGYEVLDVPRDLFKELEGYFHSKYPHTVQRENEVPYFITGDRNMVTR